MGYSRPEWLLDRLAAAVDKLWDLSVLAGSGGQPRHLYWDHSLEMSGADLWFGILNAVYVAAHLASNQCFTWPGNN